MRKKRLSCPVCGFKRLVDADERVISELYDESKMPPGWKADYFAKCCKCGCQIGIKKVG